MLASSSAPSSSSAPLSSSSSSFDAQTKAAPAWKELLKSSAPYADNHHYYSAEYPCRYSSNPPGSPAGLQTIITTTTKVSQGQLGVRERTGLHFVYTVRFRTPETQTSRSNPVREKDRTNLIRQEDKNTQINDTRSGPV